MRKAKASKNTMGHKYVSIAKEGLIALFLSAVLFLLVLYPNIPHAIEQMHRQEMGVGRLAGIETPKVYEFADAVQRSNHTPEWFIGERIKYASDFDVWGNFDYWETPDEVIDAGRTDCEGTAVLTNAVYNAINRRNGLNLETEIVSQQHHVYVQVQTSQNKTVEIYKVPEKAGLEKIVEGFIEFVSQMPPLRLAVLAAGLSWIWFRYALHVRRLFKKQPAKAT